MTPECTITVRSPADLVAVTPYLIGFHPTDSVVVIGVDGARVSFGARFDLPPPGGEEAVHIAAVVAAQQARSVTVIGYGQPELVTPAVLRLTHALEVFGVRIDDTIRVTDGRWWSYECGDLHCCPAEGKPCHPPDSVVAAEATLRGQVALPSRQALVAQVAAVEGEARAAMVAATDRARERMTELSADDLRADRTARSVRRAGFTAVREAEKRYRSGRPLTDDEIAWLGVLLTDRDVNEYALDRCGTQDWRIRLWTDVVRRVEPAYVPAPACLLSFAAWKAGQGALARVAVDRALAQDRQYPLAGLLDDVLGFGIGPHVVTGLDRRGRVGGERSGGGSGQARRPFHRRSR
jgi:hypothetical protein